MKLTKLIESEYTSMNYFAEKIFFGSLTLISSGVAALGAILSEGDARWFYVTFAVGTLVSTCMALMTRRNESMKVVCGRFLFSVIITILGTRIIPYMFPSMMAIHDDPLLLGCIAAAVNILAFTVGYGLIRSLDDEKVSIGKWLKEILIMLLTKK